MKVALACRMLGWIETNTNLVHKFVACVPRLLGLLKIQFPTIDMLTCSSGTLFCRCKSLGWWGRVGGGGVVGVEIEGSTNTPAT